MAEEAMVMRPEAAGRRAVPFVEWLTVERAGYALATVLAVGIRLWGLGATALGAAEATQALPALAAMRAGTAPGVAADLVAANPFTAISPLLYALQRVTFGLFGAGDSAARFWPALLAGLSPLLFYFLRGRLGQGGALAAAFLWAISPLGVWSSRLGVGDALVPTLSLALLVLVAGVTRGRAWGFLLGLASGLLLISGSNAYTTLLAALLALPFFAPGARGLWSDVRGVGRFVLLGAGAALLAASNFLSEPAGLAAAVALPGRWLADLLPGGGEYGVVEMLWRVVLTELTVVGFGIAGLVWALRRGDRFGGWLGAATGVALLAALIGRGRHPVDLALVALGLTLLAGPAVSRVISNMAEARGERDPWILVLVSLALLIAAATAIPSGLSPANTPDWRTLYLGVGIACLVMLAVVWVAYGTWNSWRVVGQVVPFVLLLFGLAWQVGQMVSLAYDRAGWRHAAIVHEMPANDLADLQKLLIDFGGLTGGGRDATIDVAWPDLVTDPAVPVLRWQLRDFESARFGAAVPAEPARVVITPLIAEGAENPARLDGYSGQAVGVSQRWNPAEQLNDFTAALRWVLYREARTVPEKTSAIFWVKW